MQLWLVRHAEAEELRVGITDAQRALTKKGKKRWKKGVRGLDDLGVRFDFLAHSPLRRAVETADLATPILRGESAVTTDLARPPSDALLDFLRDASDASTPPLERVAVVGHEPWLTDLAVWLVFDWRSALSPTSPPWLELEKGGVAVLEGELVPGRMRLVALHRARTLRRLGRTR